MLLVLPVSRCETIKRLLTMPLPLLPGPSLVSNAGVEVFVFHWGCTRLGALGDAQRARLFVPTEGQNLFSLSLIIFFRQFPNRFVPRVLYARNEKPCRHVGN